MDGRTDGWTDCFTSNTMQEEVTVLHLHYIIIYISALSMRSCGFMIMLICSCVQYISMILTGSLVPPSSTWKQNQLCFLREQTNHNHLAVQISPVDVELCLYVVHSFKRHTRTHTFSLPIQPTCLLENITALKWKPQIPRKESPSEDLTGGMFILHFRLWIFSRGWRCTANMQSGHKKRSFNMLSCLSIDTIYFPKVSWLKIHDFTISSLSSAPFLYDWSVVM